MVCRSYPSDFSYGHAINVECVSPYRDSRNTRILAYLSFVYTNLDKFEQLITMD